MTTALDSRPVTYARFTHRPLFMRLPGHGKVALILISVFVAIALVGPVLPWTDAYGSDPMARLLPFGSPGHILGTDEVGRDMLSRLVVGMRSSLIAAICPVLLSLAIGATIGIFAGMSGRRINAVLMRLVDIAYALPAVLLALLLATSIGPGIPTTIIALTFVWIPPTARIAESETVRFREAEFVTVAKVSGAGPLTIAVQQILPAILPGVLAYSTSLVGGSIAIVGGLGFIGLGPASPEAELGSMIDEMQTAIYSQPTLALLPAVVTLLLAMLFPIFGDALGKALVGRRG